MDSDPDPGSLTDSERGLVTAQFMLVAALSMAFMAFILYLIALQYAQGVVRSALDEGVRIGAPAPATPDDCEQAATRVLGELLGGPLGADLVVSCSEGAGLLVARADGSFAGWFPGVPDLPVAFEVVAVKESDE